MEAKVSKIKVIVRSEKTKSFLKTTFTYLGCTVWANKEGRPILYLHLVDDESGRFSVRQASQCRAIGIDGKKIPFKIQCERTIEIDHTL